MRKLKATLHHPDFPECPEAPRGTRRVRKTWEYLAKVQEGRYPQVTVCGLCLPDPDWIAHDVIHVTSKEES
jgi:hypothetical protein